MPEPRIIVHIGMHKTGTTLIQRMLRTNRELLLAAGVLHPSAGIPPGHNNAHRGLLHALRHVDGGQWETLAAEVNRAGVSTAVISNEEFSRCTEVEVALIRDKLREFDARILVYVRNEWDFMLAACRQNWKAGIYGGTLRGFLDANIERCDYARYIDRWVDVFGFERVSVVLYDKVAAEPGLVDDFVGRLGLRTDVERVVRTALVRHHKLVNASVDDDVAMTQGRITALEDRLPDRVTRGGSLQRLRRHLNRQTPTGRALVAVARPRRPMYTDDDRDWLRDRTATWHQRFLDRFVDPVDHHFLDF
ncbi:MAG: hypothetical protein OES57_02320 [Acidimicrobiia bacterium]|nr:hypothetical protein [Acidimicrobiia bacterium]